VTLENDNAVAIVYPIQGKLLKSFNVGKRPRGITIVGAILIAQSEYPKAQVNSPLLGHPSIGKLFLAKS
jgi:hypothetical protein